MWITSFYNLSNGLEEALEDLIIVIASAGDTVRRRRSEHAYPDRLPQPLQLPKLSDLVTHIRIIAFASDHHIVKGI